MTDRHARPALGGGTIEITVRNLGVLTSAEVKFWRSVYIGSVAAHGNKGARQEAAQAVYDLRSVLERSALAEATIESRRNDAEPLTPPEGRPV